MTHPQACSNFKTTTVVQVVDDCDKCENSQVNLQAGPFSKLASLDVGRVAIEYREVRRRRRRFVRVTAVLKLA